MVAPHIPGVVTNAPPTESEDHEHQQRAEPRLASSERRHEHRQQVVFDLREDSGRLTTRSAAAVKSRICVTAGAMRNF